MDQSRLVSILLSLCLHAGIFGAAIFWPASSPRMVNLNATIIELSQYTIGSPGARSTAPKPVDKPAAPEAKPATPEAPEAKPEPPKTPPVQPPKAPEKPEPKPEAPKAPDAKPISENKKDDPPKQVNATKTAAAEAPKKPAQKPEDVLKKALGDLGGNKPQTGAKPGGSGKPDPNSVAAALGAFKKAGAGDGDTGTGPGGSGGDGVGIVGTYQQSLVSRIRPFWEYAGRADRKNPQAVARITIAKDGTILGAKIEKSSGDASFDGSVLKAINDTGKVEPPPTPQLMDITLGFAYESLAGGQ